MPTGASNSGGLQPSLADRLLRPIVFTRPERIENSAWLGHVPFAFWLAEAAKPFCFVELGTQSGVSYAAFLQAATRLSAPIKAFAVDTWTGDPQSGIYGEEVFNDFRTYHDARYGAFSTLLRMTFDEAAAYFDESSIDLLHIDGYHTYESVSQDFATWLPKLSSRAVVLLHDINVREREFGVWRVWAEQCAKYASFEFAHSHGLGVLAVGSEVSEPIRWLVDQSTNLEASCRIRDFFAFLGQNTIEQRLRRHSDSLAAASVERLAKIEALFAGVQRELEQAGTYARQLECELGARDVALAAAIQAAEATRSERDAAAATLAESITAAEATRSERDDAAAALAESIMAAEAARSERDAAEAACRASENAAEATRAERDSIKAALDEAGVYARHVEAEFARATAALEKVGPYSHMLEAQLSALLNSRSWRALALLRAVKNRMRGVRNLQRSADLNASTKVDDQKAALQAKARASLRHFLSSNERVVFVKPGSPVISAVIVLWNQAHLTLLCLRALQQEALRPAISPVEVIVVDNGSSDQTTELLDKLDGVHIIRNSSNVGFVRAVNQAAKCARGDYLLFLNNDAFLRPGTLVAAETSLRRDANIGAVGGRVVLLSGLLQEAGSIIWSDGSTLGYGRGLPGDAGQAMFRREVDYCSGAFLMTPRSVWEKLGGFDDAYSPGLLRGCRLLHAAARSWSQGGL